MPCLEVEHEAGSCRGSSRYLLFSVINWLMRLIRASGAHAYISDGFMLCSCASCASTEVGSSGEFVRVCKSLTNSMPIAEEVGLV
jgi:hypothetical protein